MGGVLSSVRSAGVGGAGSGGCEASAGAGGAGFGTGGATFDDVQLMLNTVDGKASVKASGGVRDIETALKYIGMGVKRLGTSNGIKIVSGETTSGGY